MDLNPAGCLFDALPWVVRPPALHEAHSQDAQPAQVINPNACSSRQTCRGFTGSNFNTDLTLQVKLCRNMLAKLHMLGRHKAKVKRYYWHTNGSHSEQAIYETIEHTQCVNVSL